MPAGKRTEANMTPLYGGGGCAGLPFVVSSCAHPAASIEFEASFFEVVRLFVCFVCVLDWSGRCLLVCLFGCLLVSLFVRVLVCLLCLLVCLYVGLFICLVVCVFVCLFVC